MFKDVNTSSSLLEFWHRTAGLILLCMVFTVIKINKKIGILGWGCFLYLHFGSFFCFSCVGVGVFILYILGRNFGTSS